MKRKVWIRIIFGLIISMLIVVFLNFYFYYWQIPYYILPENIVQISATYCDDALIVLTGDCLYTYDVNNINTIKLDRPYRKICAKSKDDIILIDEADNIYHYKNGIFNNVAFSNDILDVTYIWKSYIILDCNNNVFIENKLLCNLDLDYKPCTIAGTLGVSYDLTDIWFWNKNNMLYSYNLNSNSIQTVSDAKKCQFVPTGSIYLSKEGEIFEIEKQSDGTYIFIKIDCKNNKISEIIPLKSGYGYLLLSENNLQRIKLDLSGNYYLHNSFSDTVNVFQKNIIQKDLLRDWKMICFVNNIDEVENIFTSPFSKDNFHQVFYLKSGSTIYVYEQ